MSSKRTLKVFSTFLECGSMHRVQVDFRIMRKRERVLTKIN